MMIKQEINQDIRISDKAYKKHGLWAYHVVCLNIRLSPP